MKTADVRKRELAQIHIAKQQLGLDDETYRAMLWSVAQVKSAKDLDWTGRKRVLEHLVKCGAKLHPDGHKGHPGKPHSLDKKPLLAKIEAQLAEMGLFWGYAEGILKRMHQVDRLDFATAQQLKDIVAALAVEQEKRRLLNDVDALLKRLGLTRQWVRDWLGENLPGRATGWERHRATLRRLIDVLKVMTDD